MSELKTQIGGSHYKNCAIQPVEFSESNGLKFLEGCVVKRVTRHDKDGGKGREDIEKAIHELKLLLELRYAKESRQPKAYAVHLTTQEPSEQIMRESYGGTE